MQSKIIGIVAASALHTRGFELDRAGRDVSRCVAAAGGLPILLPNLPELVPDYISRVDGLVLVGGDNDICPSWYGADNLASRDIQPEKDALDFAAIRAGLARGIPILGICRGCQAINVALGGSLRQSIDSVIPHDHPANPAAEQHAIRIAESRILPAGSYAITSLHRQAADRLGAGIRPAGWAEDGTVELIEHESAPVVGVQWHPEFRPDCELTRRLFGWLAG